MEARFVLMRTEAKLPSKKHINDAGYDLAWAPVNGEFADKRWHGGELYENALVIRPGESVVLKTGLKALFPAGYVMEIKNRSGIAAKKSLLVGACIVDSTYRGEIFVNLHNVSNKDQVIQIGDRIAQCIFYSVENMNASEISEKDYSEFETSRGEGSLGSTGIK